MDWLNDKLNRIEEKVDRVDAKLDLLNTRQTRTETDVTWMKGSLYIILTIGLSVIAFIANKWANLISLIP